MSETLNFRPMEPADAEAVSRLILAAFGTFIAQEYNEEGRREFTRYVEPAELIERVAAGHFLLLAEQDERLAGVIELRNHDHVSLLFVDEAFQHRGIARDLLSRALAVARPARPALERVTVNSSRFAVLAYERLGFRQTGPERTVNGIVFIPMAHELTSD